MKMFDLIRNLIPAFNLGVHCNPKMNFSLDLLHQKSVMTHDITYSIVFKICFIFHSSTINSQHKIPWLESLGQSLSLPDPQRPTTISSLRPHSNWNP